jgi:hypothetical protein
VVWTDERLGLGWRVFERCDHRAFAGEWEFIRYADRRLVGGDSRGLYLRSGAIIYRVSGKAAAIRADGTSPGRSIARHRSVATAFSAIYAVYAYTHPLRLVPQPSAWGRAQFRAVCEILIGEDTPGLAGGLETAGPPAR